jgi:hypothetical protein
MSTDGLMAIIRRHVTVLAAAIGLCGAWGSLAAIVAKVGFGLPEVQAWLFVGLPSGLLVVAALWKKLPGILGFDD